MEPLKYEDLPNGVRINLSMGHAVAAHMVEDENGIRAEHLTTVQHSGETVYYCNDVCGNDCEPGSVRLLMVEMPKKVVLDMYDVGRRRPDFDFPPTKAALKKAGLWQEREAEAVLRATPGVSLLEDMSFLAGKMEAAAESWVELHPRAEAAVAAQERLEKLQAWVWTRYRIAVLNGDQASTRHHETTLFFIVTGLKPGEDKMLYRVFQDHLSTAAVLHGAEEFPEFQPEAESDCGG